MNRLLWRALDLTMEAAIAVALAVLALALLPLVATLWAVDRHQMRKARRAR